MAVSKPTVLLIPGAWHTPASYDRLIPFLHDAGYPTLSVALPSVGASPGLPDFSQDVAEVRAAVTGLVDEGKEVVIVMHSYGAVPGTEALRGLGRRERLADGKAGGVVRLVYIAAIVLRKGETAAEVGLRDERDGGGELPRSEGAIDNKDGTMSISNGPARFYNDLPPEEAEQYQMMMLPQSAGVNTSPLTYEAYRNIRSAYLLTQEDRAINIKTQRKIVEETGIDMVESVKTSHSPFLSNPGLVASFIRRAAGEKL